jgi:hypothetical protein
MEVRVDLGCFKSRTSPLTKYSGYQIYIPGLDLNYNGIYLGEDEFFPPTTSKKFLFITFIPREFTLTTMEKQ